MNSRGFYVEVVVPADDQFLGQRLVADLATLPKTITAPAISEQIEAGVRLTTQARIQSCRAIPDAARAGTIVVSSDFLEGPPEALQVSELAKQLIGSSESTAMPIGLIAAINSAPETICSQPPAGIDCIVNTRAAHFSEALRKGVEQVAQRVWYKAPPPQRGANGVTGDKIMLDYVRSAAELEQSFKLRHKVYDILGYLEEPVRSSSLQIDVDVFDRDAIHIVARTKQDKNVVGCTRLILPSRTVNPLLEESVHCPVSVADWYGRLAARERNSALRNQLENGTFQELPTASMAAFERLMQGRRTQQCCELSRLIVAPDYRGLDLSSRLMETAIQLVSCLRRKIMLVECVPSHRRFYESFGFQLASAESSQPEEVRQLRTTAIIMWLDLESPGTTQKKKPNLLVTILSPKLSPLDLRRITSRLRSHMPLEIWLPGCRAQDVLTSEMKSIEASEASVAVHAAGSGHVRELAQAIALLLEQVPGLSVRVREERNGHRDFQTVRGEVPGWESIRADLLKLLQWNESMTLNEPS
jgi:GNAT superfamily N-acetyltransferase